MAIYLTLFMTAWVSATLWPMASEAVFVALVHQNSDALLLLLMTASAGNILGSVTMYELAKASVNRFNKSKPTQKQKINKAVTLLQKYGAGVLVFAWLPVVGDLLPVAAGVLHIKRLPVYFAISLGKVARYAVLATAVSISLNS